MPVNLDVNDIAPIAPDVVQSNVGEASNQPDSDALKLINSWIAVEGLNPVSVKSIDQISEGREYDMAVLPMLMNESLPWETGYPSSNFPSGANGYLAYDVIFGDIGTAQSNRFLANLYGDVSIESATGSGTCLIATLRVGPNGCFYLPERPSTPRLLISAFAVNLVFAANKDFEKMHQVDDIIMNITRRFFEEFEEFEENPISQSDIPKMYYFLLDQLGFDTRFVNRPAKKTDMINRPVKICGHFQKINPDGSLKKKRDPATLILNSFFLDSLLTARNRLKMNSAPELLRRYLGDILPNNQTDIMKNSRVLEGLLQPKNFPLGKWPQQGHNALVSLQQATVNYALHERAVDQQRIIGVNGPPGTGKTTLLKDLVAGLVVKRAMAMVKFDRPTEAFQYQHNNRRRGSTGGKLELDRSLVGYEVIVASSNNAAVENVSVEWVTKEAIHDQTPDDKFSAMAASLSGRESWGLISAAMGNAGNRQNFINKFWFNPDLGMDAHFQVILGRSAGVPIAKTNPPQMRAPRCVEAYQTPRSIGEAMRQWADVVVRFNAALEKVQMVIAAKQETCGKLNMDDYEALHLSSPWFTEQENIMREELFTLAMEVHRCFINAAPKEASATIKEAINMLSGFADISGNAAARLAPIFLVVPVISTTFASVKTMLGTLPDKSIGWLIVDEAGQATPQSAVGAISVARNAIVVGDPIQVEPVVSTSEVLIAEIAKAYQVDINSSMAPTASVQTFADAASNLCAEYESSYGTRRVGIPLLAHRRCADPMFSISNKIGYGGLMVNAKGPGRSAIRDTLGKSRWINVIAPEPGKWVEEEGVEVINMLKKLADAGVPMNLYIITPFRAVENKMKQMIIDNAEYIGIGHQQAVEMSKRVGTVHKVQGREAEAVIMVLGQQGKSLERARQWAGGMPNIPNVAVTRAKEVLYVVGNRDEWSRAGYFRDVDMMIDGVAPQQRKAINHQSATSSSFAHVELSASDLLDMGHDDQVRVMNI
jgi:hypothetical protein